MQPFQCTGDLVTISFGGQHALNYRPGDADGRAEWYFEEGKHGGTLTDIAVHGVDISQWIARSKVSKQNRIIYRATPDAMPCCGLCNTPLPLAAL